MLKVTEIKRKLNKPTKWFNYQAYELDTKVTTNIIREWNVTVNTISYDIDGIDGTMLLDAKCVGNVKSSPYTNKGGNIQSRVNVKQTSEFQRALYIINNSSFQSFTIVVNRMESANYFTQIAMESGFEMNVNFFIIVTNNF